MRGVKGAVAEEARITKDTRTRSCIIVNLQNDPKTSGNLGSGKSRHAEIRRGKNKGEGR